jgi:hypothetical protein
LTTRGARCAVGDSKMPNQGETPRLWPADNPAVLAHIALLQGIINRLANNSASCKTWCLTLVAALISLAGATHVPSIVTGALVPIVIFGLVDAMYLAQERAYRDLYARVVEDIRKDTYALAKAFEVRAPLSFWSCLKAVCSWSIFPVYVGLIAFYVVAHCVGWLTILAKPPGM